MIFIGGESAVPLGVDVGAQLAPQVFVPNRAKFFHRSVLSAMRPHLRRAALLLAITLPSLHAASIPQEEVALLHGQELPDLEPALLQAGAEEAKAEAEAERWRRPKYVPKMEDAEEAKLQALIRASEGLPYQEDVPAWPATGLTPAAQAPAAEEPATDGGDVEQSDMLRPA